MTNRTIFMVILTMIFLAVMGVGLTLIFKDKTKDALDVFTGGAFLAVFVMIIGGGLLLQDGE